MVGELVSLAVEPRGRLAGGVGVRAGPCERCATLGLGVAGTRERGLEAFGTRARELGGGLGLLGAGDQFVAGLRRLRPLRRTAALCVDGVAQRLREASLELRPDRALGLGLSGGRGCGGAGASRLET